MATEYDHLLWRPKRTLCLWWALAQYRRFSRLGKETYLACRKSRYLRLRWIPHVLVAIATGDIICPHCKQATGAQGIQAWSFVPDQPERLWVPPLRGFKGHVEAGDPDHP